MPNVSILQAPQSNNGTMITPSAGSNRLVLYTVLLYSGTAVVMPATLTINGVAGVFAFGDAPSSTPTRAGASTWYFKESDIGTIAAQAVTIGAYTGSLEGRMVTVLQDAFQGAPFATALAHSSSGTLSQAMARDNNSLSLMISQSANVNATLTLTEPSYIGRTPLSITSVSYGYASDTFRTVASTTITNGYTGMTVANFKSVGAVITLINNGNSIAIGSTIPVTTTGFTGTPTASFNVAGISASVTGSANSWSLAFDERVDGAVFPALPATVNLTLTNGAELATLAMPSYTKKSTEVEVVFSNAVTSDSNYISGALTAAGFTAQDGAFIYTPYGDFVAFPDGSWVATTNGVVTGWFRPATGTGAGNVYPYTFTIGDGGVVTDATPGKITGAAIKNKFLSGSTLTGKTL